MTRIEPTQRDRSRVPQPMNIPGATTLVGLAWRIAALGASTLLAAGCASTYSNLVSGSHLGAAEYTPAVVAPTAEARAKYDQVLPICRQVAANRQVTASQEAQLKTITGAAGGAATGAAMGLQMGALLKGVGGDVSLNKAAGIGLGAGLLASVGGAFASGAEDAAAQTKKILLRCLKSQEQGAGYTVLEDL